MKYQRVTNSSNDINYTFTTTVDESVTIDLGKANKATTHQFTVERGTATAGTVKVKATPFGMTTPEGYVKDVDLLTDLVFPLTTAAKRTVDIDKRALTTLTFELIGANGTVNIALAGIR